MVEEGEGGAPPGWPALLRLHPPPLACCLSGERRVTFRLPVGPLASSPPPHPQHATCAPRSQPAHPDPLRRSPLREASRTLACTLGCPPANHRGCDQILCAARRLADQCPGRLAEQMGLAMPAEGLGAKRPNSSRSPACSSCASLGRSPARAPGGPARLAKPRGVGTSPAALQNPQPAGWRPLWRTGPGTRLNFLACPEVPIWLGCATPQPLGRGNLDRPSISVVRPPGPLSFQTRCRHLTRIPHFTSESGRAAACLPTTQTIRKSVSRNNPARPPSNSASRARALPAASRAAPPLPGPPACLPLVRPACLPA